MIPPGAPPKLLFSSARPQRRVPYPCAAVAQGWATTKASPVVALAFAFPTPGKKSSPIERSPVPPVTGKVSRSRTCVELRTKSVQSHQVSQKHPVRRPANAVLQSQTRNEMLQKSAENAIKTTSQRPKVPSNPCRMSRIQPKIAPTHPFSVQFAHLACQTPPPGATGLASETWEGCPNDLQIRGI